MRPSLTTPDRADATRTRIYIRNPDGITIVRHFDDPSLAYALYLGLPKGVRAAFRSANDTTEVLPWDFVDR